MPAKTPTLHPPDHQRPSHCGTMPGTAMRPWARTMTRTTTPRTWTCNDCVLVGQTLVCYAGGDASAMRAKMPAQRGCQRQRNAGKDISAMLARMLAQGGRGCQRNTGKTASTRLTGHEGQVAGEQRRLRQQKPQTTTMSTTTMPCTLMCHDCIVTGRMPVCNAYNNVGVTQVTSPAQQGQRCQRDAGSDAVATPVKMTVQCW
jgi:hypothetical protein